MSRIYGSLIARVICVVLVVLLAVLLVLQGFPAGRQQRVAKAEGLGWSVLITFIVELCGGFYDVGLDKLCEYLSKDDPNYDSQIAVIKQLLGNINVEVQDIADALSSIGGVVDQMMEYENNLNLKDIFTSIDTAWDSYQDNVWNTTTPAIPQFCKGVMEQYKLETAVRTIYNYISHKNQPRSALDKYTDLLIEPTTSVGGTQDFSTRVATTDGSKVVVERPTYFDYNGWTGGHDAMGASGPARDFYFAEGTSRTGFDTYFCIQNPESGNAHVRLTYMMSDGRTRTQDILVPATSRATVHPADVIGQGVDFSTRVHSSDAGVIAERPMYFNYGANNAGSGAGGTGGLEGASSSQAAQLGWTGGHTTVGAAAPGKEFYFAEGTCRPGFDSYLCVQNPMDRATRVKTTFMRGDGSQKEQTFDMAAHSRYTLRADDVIGRGDGPSYDFSAKVASTDGGTIVAERPMYFDYRGWTGGHDVMGATAPGKEFYFAEGTCRPGFDPYICLQNPSNSRASVALTYMRGDGTTADQGVAVPAHSRVTVQPKEVLGSADDAAHDFSTRVVCTSGEGIVAERPMYFNYKSNWTGGHDVMGASSPRSDWYFAEGTIRKGFVPYYCIQNPGSGPSNVRMTFMGSDGRPWTKDIVVPAHSRKTVAATDTMSTLMNNYCGMEEYFSRLIHEQLCAADLVLEAKNYDPVHYGAANDYVKNSLEPMIREEVDCFRDNLGQDGAAVLSRANFVCEMLANKALNDTTPKLMGSMISTQDLIPAGQGLELKAYNKTSGQLESASKTTIVPEYAPSMSEPYNATNWKGPGLKDTYYDQWDATGASVAPNNNFSIIWYEFSNVSPGFYYDIKDTNGKVVAANVPVARYGDDYVQSDSGDNIFGNFTAVQRGTGGGKVMMSNWTDKVINDGSGCGKADNYDIKTLTPKHVSTKMHLHEDESDYELYAAHQFTYTGPSNRAVSVGAQYTTSGQLKIDDCRVGDYSNGRYKLKVYDVTGSVETQVFEKDWNLDESGGGDKTKTISDSWTDYLGTGELPAAGAVLQNGHVYEVRVHNFVSGDAIGVMTDTYSNVDLLINTLYLVF
jgi:hypothetical protein